MEAPCSGHGHKLKSQVARAGMAIRHGHTRDHAREGKLEKNIKNRYKHRLFPSDCDFEDLFLGSFSSPFQADTCRKGNNSKMIVFPQICCQALGVLT